MKQLKWLLALFFVFGLVACEMGGGGGDPESDYQLQLLHFADVDGGRDILSNAQNFSALVDKFRGEMSDSTVVLSSGDNWIPGPEYNVASDAALESELGAPGVGRAHVAWLNALGVQASAFGNHEFDQGTGAVAEILAESTDEDTGGTWEGAQFPYLAANLDFSTDEDLAPLVGSDGAEASSLANQIAGYAKITLGDGEVIGVVGATTPTLASISSPGDVTILPEDADDRAALAAEIQTAVDALGAEGIDKIIVLSHMQRIVVEQELAPLLSDVDIIVAGGSNTILADDDDRLRDGDTAAGTYPLELTGEDGNPVLIVNTDGDYSYLGRLVVDFDADGVILTSLLDAEVSGAYATDEDGLDDEGLSEDDAIDGVVTVSEALGTALEARAGNVVGVTSVYLNGERGDVRTQETNLGNLTADANLAYAQSVDPETAISIKNGGGIRASIGSCVLPPGSDDEDDLECNPPLGTPGISEEGEISQLDLEIALRFNNGLTTLTVTGAQLYDVIEHSVGAVEDVGGRFPQIGGMTFSYDPSLEAGSRVQTLTVLDSNGAADGGEEVTVVADGELVAEAAATEFRVVTLGFLAEGGDDYPFPSDIAADVFDLVVEGEFAGAADFAETGTEQDVLAEFLLSNHGDVDSAYAEEDTSPSEDERIVNLAARAGEED